MPFFRSRSLSLQFCLTIGLLLALTGSRFSQALEARAQVLQQYPQALNMSGYVLNAETNMNQVYSRQMGYGLLPLRDTQPPESLIEIEGSLVPPLRQLQQSPFLLNLL